MNSVTLIPFITLPTCADTNYNFEMLNSQNTNEIANSHRELESRIEEAVKAQDYQLAAHLKEQVSFTLHAA